MPKLAERPPSDAAMRMATEIVVAYLGKRTVEPDELPTLVAAVRRALTGEHTPADVLHRLEVCEYDLDAALDGQPQTLASPAAHAGHSIARDYLVCLEEGGKFRSLKRHLMAKHGLTPDEYRAKWCLPRDYPMVAPSYAEHHPKRT